MNSPASDFRKKLFGRLARLDVRHPWAVIFLSFALSVACVFYTRARLQFHTGQDDMVSANNREGRDYLHYTSEFPDLDGLIVVAKAGHDPKRAEHFADAFAKVLHADHANVKSVFYRIDPGVLGNRALLYLPLAELDHLAANIGAAIPMLRGYAADPTLARIFAMANAQFDSAMGSRAAPAASSGKASAGRGRPVAGASNSENGAAGADFRFLDPILSGMLASASPSAATNPPKSPWGALGAKFAKGRENAVLRDGYLSSENGEYLLMYVAPGDGVKHGPDPVGVIQRDLDAVRAQFPGLEAGMTGGPALAHAEQTTTAHDMALASVIAITSNIALIVIPFRGLVEPFFAIIALLVGVAWSFGFTTVAVGHLNLLSAVFTSILAGIGINFPIHLMARYDEARRMRLEMPEAMELAVVNTGTGVFASACIMALAFLMPVFTDFKGIAELGLISAAGLFLCLLSALFVFPAMIALRDRNRPPAGSPHLSLAPRRSTLEKLFAYPKIIVGASIAVTVAAAFLIRGVGFNQNLLKLQANGVEAVKYEKILLHNSGRSSWFAVSLARTSAEADRRAAAFRKLPEVADVQTLSTYIPDHQKEKRAILASIRSELAPVKIRNLPARQDPRLLIRALSGLAARLEAVKRISPTADIVKTSALVDDAIERLRKDPQVFDSYERAIAEELKAKLVALDHKLSPAEVTEKNLPRVLRRRFIGKTGLYLVQIYPKGNVWSDVGLKRFVDALETVDPNVTGPPVQTYAIATVMRHGYERAAVLALIAVFVFVFADFRNLRDALLATVPLLFGGLWLLEAMGGLGWQFNLANLFAVPVIIGMGVDNGVNMIYRWREERDKSSLILTKAVGKSVTICSLTTIAAFAALITASHRGISSLGWVLSLGVTLILIATLIVLPALFEVLGSRVTNSRNEPQAAASEGDEGRAPRKAAGTSGG